jgi:hypothetical protein
MNMNTKQKPILRLLSCDASLAQAQQFVEEMTGEKMTPDGIEELRRIWEDVSFDPEWDELQPLATR